MTRYVNSQLNGISIRGVSIRGGTKPVPYHVTFGGKTAPVNVVIHNALRYSVQVGLLVQADQAEVSGRGLTRITIPPGNFSSAVTLTVHVRAKQGKIRLTLVSPSNSPLAGHPLPAYPLVIIVHPTNFGTFALAIFAVALALFVTASAFRAIRNVRHARPSRSRPVRHRAGTRRRGCVLRPKAALQLSRKVSRIWVIGLNILIASVIDQDGLLLVHRSSTRSRPRLVAERRRSPDELARIAGPAACRRWRPWSGIQRCGQR